METTNVNCSFSLSCGRNNILAALSTESYICGIATICNGKLRILRLETCIRATDKASQYAERVAEDISSHKQLSVVVAVLDISRSIAVTDKTTNVDTVNCSHCGESTVIYTVGDLCCRILQPTNHTTHMSACAVSSLLDSTGDSYIYIVCTAEER